MVPLTSEEKNYIARKKYAIYEKKILSAKYDKNDTKYQKVRDHCNYTGKYRGTAHDI